MQLHTHLITIRQITINYWLLKCSDVFGLMLELSFCHLWLCIQSLILHLDAHRWFFFTALTFKSKTIYIFFVLSAVQCFTRTQIWASAMQVQNHLYATLYKHIACMCVWGVFFFPDLWDGVYLLLAQTDKARPVLTDQQELYMLPRLLAARSHACFYIPLFSFPKMHECVLPPV